MVFTTYLWWFGGWFILVLITLDRGPDQSQRNSTIKTQGLHQWTAMDMVCWEMGTCPCNFHGENDKPIVELGGALFFGLPMWCWTRIYIKKVQYRGTYHIWCNKLWCSRTNRNSTRNFGNPLLASVHICTHVVTHVRTYIPIRSMEEHTQQ